jgi:L-cysteine S-thiosulfotransferase
MKHSPLLLLLSIIATTTWAQSSVDTIREIERYRAMLADGNPAELNEARGEDLWNKPSGPKKAALNACDLGLGAGVVEGAAAQLPRYFKDVNKVQDLEARLLTCLQQHQGYTATEIKAVIDMPFGRGLKKDVVDIATYIAGASRDKPVKVSLAHPQEKLTYELGKRMFYYQAGSHDFSCATCHGQEDKRIRMQDLPNITTKKGAAFGWTSWPAYRVSNSQLWSMQWRLNDCFRQQRFPEPVYASDLTVALSLYMAANANGELVATPGLKR